MHLLNNALWWDLLHKNQASSTNSDLAGPANLCWQRHQLQVSPSAANSSPHPCLHILSREFPCFFLAFFEVFYNFYSILPDILSPLTKDQPCPVDLSHWESSAPWHGTTNRCARSPEQRASWTHRMVCWCQLVVSVHYILQRKHDVCRISQKRNALKMVFWVSREVLPLGSLVCWETTTPTGSLYSRKYVTHSSVY